MLALRILIALMKKQDARLIGTDRIERTSKTTGRGTEWDNILDEEMGFVYYPPEYPPEQMEKIMGEEVVVEKKNILKSKSFWFNIATGALGLFTNAYASVPGGNATVTAVIAAGNIFLRSLTTQPVTVLPQKKDDF